MNQDVELLLLLQEINELKRLNAQLNDNLSSVQARCTELLEENRELKRWTFVPEGA